MNLLIKNTCLIGTAILLFGSCMSARKLTHKGNRKFEIDEFELANKLYQKALAKGGDKAKLNFKIAESLRLSNRIKESLPFYKAALDENFKNDTARYNYAVALKANEQYPEAEKVFSSYSKEGRVAGFVKKARLEVESMKQLRFNQTKNTGYSIKNAENLNTDGADYAPYYYDDKLFFTSSRNQKEIFKGNGLGFTDIYRLKFDSEGSEMGSVESFSSKINNPNLHEACLTFTDSGSTVVFARSNDGSKNGRKEVDLYISYFRDGDWSIPELLPFNNENAWTSTPSFSPDGKTLYFSSNRKGGYGGIDLYKINRTDTSWGDVINLGGKMNTVCDELFPYLSKSGKFYFSSNGLPGLGNLDLFSAVRDANGNLKVENLGTPINSASDDFGITWVTDSTGYYTSNRKGGKGDDDMYTFIRRPVFEVIYLLDITTFTKGVQGQDSLMTHTNLRLNDEVGTLLLDTTVTGSSVSLPIDPERVYTLFAEKKGFISKSTTFSTIGKMVPLNQLKEGKTEIKMETRIQLEKLLLGQVIVLENIYYDYDKADIRDDAGIELDKLVTILVENPSLKIELSSHTDSRGNDEYNMSLSQRRAEAAVAYIITKGISSDRLTAKGYGESVPMVTENNEEDMQKNRRTEFKVISID